MEVEPISKDVDLESKQYKQRSYSSEGVSVHVMAESKPWEVGFQLTTAIVTPFLLAYPALIMPVLGWTRATIVVALVVVVSIYSNVLLARLNVIDNIRYYRFRDISGKVFGSIGYWSTLTLQWVNIFTSNVAGVIINGQALQGFCEWGFGSSNNTGITEYIFVTGIVLSILSVATPDMHNLRLVSIITSICAAVYFTIIIGITINNGISASPRTYHEDISPPVILLQSFVAVAAIALIYNPVLLPEIQATIENDPVEGFYRAMVLPYAVGLPILLAVLLVGFWAYGTAVASDITSSLIGPPWMVALAWLGIFTQGCACFQLYMTPVFEAIDNRISDKTVGVWSPYNVAVRTMYRVPMILSMAFLAAMFPFFGGFVALAGALSCLPLNFVLTFLLHLRVNRGKLSFPSIVFHLLLVIVFAVITVGASIGSIQSLIADDSTYQLFASTQEGSQRQGRAYIYEFGG